MIQRDQIQGKRSSLGYYPSQPPSKMQAGAHQKPASAAISATASGPAIGADAGSSPGSAQSRMGTRWGTRTMN